MKCQMCSNDKMVFKCVTITGAHITACINCVVKYGLKILGGAKEKEVRDDNAGVEEKDSRKGLL